MEWRFRVSDSGQRLRNTTYTKWCPLDATSTVVNILPPTFATFRPLPSSCLSPPPRADHPLFPSQLFDDEISWAYGQVSLGA